MFPKAKAALEKALALDPDVAEAHAIAAQVEFWFEWNWAAAEKSFGRVLALNPGNATARGMYAWLLLSRRRLDESLAEIKRALALEPLMPVIYAWSVGLHAAAGRNDEALADFSRLQQIEPNFGLAYFHAGTAYFRKGMIDEAIETLQKGCQLVVFPGWNEVMLLLCYLKKGARAKAEQMLAEMLEERKRHPVSAMCLAWSFAALGDFDSAFEWLETAVRERDSVMVIVHVYTEFAVPELARDPRFVALLDRLQLPH
jgi:serine/threonine-protein kinase